MNAKKPGRRTSSEAKATKSAEKPAAKAPPRRTKRTLRALVDAPPDKCFWVNFGPVVRNLRELNDALATMSEDQFAHHVDKTKNDFASWVEGVLEDAACANSLRRSRTLAAARRVVEKSLATYA